MFLVYGRCSAALWQVTTRKTAAAASFEPPRVDRLKQTSLVLHLEDNQSQSVSYNEADILVVTCRYVCVRVCAFWPEACVDLTVFRRGTERVGGMQAVCWVMGC